MKKETSTFRDVVEQVCSGSEEATWELIETYGPHIQRVIRRRLNHHMRSKFDSLDFVQMVWASFFADRDQIAKFKEPEELLGYLAKMAQLKILQESRRRLKYAKHNVRRERPLETTSTPESTHVRKSTTPSQIMMAKEQLEGLLHEVSQRDQQVVEMRMNGATFHEISAALGIHERTARHVIEKLALIEHR